MSIPNEPPAETAAERLSAAVQRDLELDRRFARMVEESMNHAFAGTVTTTVTPPEPLTAERLREMIEAHAITAAEIQGHTITASQLVAGSITASRLADDAFVRYPPRPRPATPPPPPPRRLVGRKLDL